MKYKAVVSALCAAAALSGCYVIPIDYPPIGGHPVAVTAPGARPVAIPGPQPVPTTLQARLYPLNETAGKMGALMATVTDNVNGHATFSLSHAGDVLQGRSVQGGSRLPRIRQRPPRGLRRRPHAHGAARHRERGWRARHLRELRIRAQRPQPGHGRLSILQRREVPVALRRLGTAKRTAMNLNLCMSRAIFRAVSQSGRQQLSIWRCRVARRRMRQVRLRRFLPV